MRARRISRDRTIRRPWMMQAWADFLYMRSNTKGRYAERWRHVNGCGRFFNCVRDTVSDRIAGNLQAG